MRRLLPLLFALAACTPPDALDANVTADTDAAADTEEPATPHSMDLPAPAFALLGAGPRAQVVATFRGPEGVALGDSAAVFGVGKATHRAPLAAGPSQFEEPDGATVTQATYTLDATAYRALTTTPTDSVTVRLHIGGEARTFPFVRGDLME